MKKNIIAFTACFLYCLFYTSFTYGQYKTTALKKNPSGAVHYVELDKTEARADRSISAPQDIRFVKQLNSGDPDIRYNRIKSRPVNDSVTIDIYQQEYKGIKVDDGFCKLSYIRNRLRSATIEYSELSGISVSEKITARQAEAFAAGFLKTLPEGKGISSSAVSTGKLICRDLAGKTGAYRLAYKVEILYNHIYPVKYLYIDAQTGALLIQADAYCHINAPGTGASLYSGTVNFTGDSFGGGFRLRQNRQGVQVSTLNALNSPYPLYGTAVDFTDNDNNWTATEHPANRDAVDVHWGTEKFLDYFRLVHNRNSLDNNGLPVISNVHAREFINERMDNAFFYPYNRTMNYGEGNTIFHSLTDLDVVTHEMAHGIAYFEAALLDHGEPASVNEGLSDIWAATIEAWAAPAKNRWLTGAGIMKNGFSCLRSLSSPNTQGYRPGFTTEGNYPDTHGGQYWDAFFQQAPHINSTVLSHWYYLLVEGGSGVNDKGQAFTVRGIGFEKAARIVYMAEQQLSPGAGFQSLRTETINAASMLFGDNFCEEASVTDAWYAVGLGDAFQGPQGSPVVYTSYPAFKRPSFTRNNVCPAYQITVTPYTYNNIPANFTWESTGNPVNWYQSGNNLVFYLMDEGQDAIFRVTATNGCGTSSATYAFRGQWSGNCAGIPLRSQPADVMVEPQTNEKAFRMFPNPAAPHSVITLIHPNGIKQVRIINSSGMTVTEQQYSDAGSARRLTLGKLAAGIYRVMVYDGIQWQSAGLNIQ